MTKTANQGILGPPVSNPDTYGGRLWNVFPNAIYGTGLVDACAAVDYSTLPGGAVCP